MVINLDSGYLGLWAYEGTVGGGRIVHPCPKARTVLQTLGVAGMWEEVLGYKSVHLGRWGWGHLEDKH